MANGGAVRTGSEVIEALVAAGVEKEIAAEVAECLVEGDRSGHGSHGTRLLGIYLDRLRNGSLDGAARPVVESETGAVVRIDGRLGFGQLAGRLSVETGVANAHRNGICVVAVDRAGHMGRNGRWAEMAAKAGVYSLHFINSPTSGPTVAAPGTNVPSLKSTPLAWGAPHPDGRDVVLDGSVGLCSVNTIKAAKETGTRLHEPAIPLPDGTLTDDPNAYFGADQPSIAAFGGYKGFGLGVFMELFAGALAGRSEIPGPDAPVTNNMLSIYLDPTHLVDASAYGTFLRDFEQRLEAGNAILPGTRSRLLRERSQ